MTITGVLPASGKASRIFGLPKFAFPISESETLISWHVRKLNEICDQVIISTREEWFPILDSLNLQAEILVKEPSTLSETLRELFALCGGDVIFGMPDTVVVGNTTNPYWNLCQSQGDVILGLFSCTESLRGKVGQVKIDSGVVIDVQDKSAECTYPLMWGNILFRSKARNVDLGANTPSNQISQWISDGVLVKGVQNDGEYVDVGSFEGLRHLMRVLK